MNYNLNIKELEYDKKIEKLENIKILNKIIINTYNKYKYNYYTCININNIITYEKENNNNDIIENENREDKKEDKKEEEKIIIQQNLKDKKQNNNNNYIIGIIQIKKEDIHKQIQIINSFENIDKSGWKIKETNYYQYENEKEIKDNCRIEINNREIKFSYVYTFQNEGNYTIKYIFK